jgi:hypothetical protein
MFEELEGQFVALMIVADQLQAIPESDLWSLPGSRFEISASGIDSDARVAPAERRRFLVATRIQARDEPWNQSTIPRFANALDSDPRPDPGRLAEGLKPIEKISTFEYPLILYYSRDRGPVGELFEVGLTARDISADPRIVEVFCDSVSLVQAEEALPDHALCSLWYQWSEKPAPDKP